MKFFMGQSPFEVEKVRKEELAVPLAAAILRLRSFSAVFIAASAL